MAELLSQEEIDALLLGADEIEPEVEDEKNIRGEVYPYDFFAQDKISQARMPKLDKLNERFARFLRVSMFSLMRQPAEVSLNGTHMIKFSEYIKTLKMPTSMNMVRFKPLIGMALITIEVRLIFILVDNFFGGNGRYQTQRENPEFTPTEQRIIEKLLRIIFLDYKKAWQPLLDTSLELVHSEFNPQMAHIASPSDIVIVHSFHIEMESGGGDFHITMPHSMIEPVRDLVNENLHTQANEPDVRWNQRVTEELMAVKVAIQAKLVEKSVTIKDVMSFSIGDIIPIDIPEHITLNVESLPSFRCKLGKSREHLSLKISEKIPRPCIKLNESLSNEKLKSDEPLTDLGDNYE